MFYTILIYTFITFFIFFLCCKISYKLNLLDIPNERKIHINPTAYTGGLSLSIILLIAIQSVDIFDKNLAHIISIGFLISIVGFIDDKFQLNVGGKLSLQAIPIFYLIVFEKLALSSIGEYDYFVLELGTFSVSFTLLCVLFLINSFNYFDGLDGTLSITTITVLGILFYLVPEYNFRLFIIIILIPIITFLFFNFSFLKLPKLFLGDSGSLLMGFIISFLLIYLANQKLVHPILLAWSIVIFVYEFLAINFVRLKKKQNLFLAGTDHLHHLIFKKNNSIFFTNLFINLLNLILFSIGYFSYKMLNELVSLILFLILLLIYFILRSFFSSN